MSISLFLNESLFVNRTYTRRDVLISLQNLCKYSLLYGINEFCGAAFSAYHICFSRCFNGSRVFSVRRFDGGCAEPACYRHAGSAALIVAC